MELSETIKYCEQALTNELKNIIRNEGLVKTGTMLNSTFVRIYFTEKKLSISVISTDYYDDVNDRRRERGLQTLNTLLFESSVFEDCKQKIYKSILQQKRKDIIKELKK